MVSAPKRKRVLPLHQHHHHQHHQLQLQLQLHQWWNCGIVELWNHGLLVFWSIVFWPMPYMSYMPYSVHTFLHKYILCSTHSAYRQHTYKHTVRTTHTYIRTYIHLTYSTVHAKGASRWCGSYVGKEANERATAGKRFVADQLNSTTPSKRCGPTLIWWSGMDAGMLGCFS